MRLCYQKCWEVILVLKNLQTRFKQYLIFFNTFIFLFLSQKGNGYAKYLSQYQLASTLTHKSLLYVEKKKKKKVKANEGRGGWRSEDEEQCVGGEHSLTKAAF